MKRRHPLILDVGAALLGVLVAFAFVRVVSAEPPLAVAVVAPREAPVQATTSTPSTEATEPKGTGTLAGYVLTAILDWTKGRDAAPATHKAEIARDIAIVALEETRIWTGSDGAREALVLASIAFHESRFRDYVEQCNDAAWAKTKEARALLLLGDCDGALSGYAQAVGLWQVHYECGAIVLYVDGAWQNACSTPSMQPHWTITKAIAVESRRDQARVALAMARQSIRVGAGLRNYVGGEGPERAGMAASRLDKAIGYHAKHPFAP